MMDSEDWAREKLRDEVETCQRGELLKYPTEEPCSEVGRKVTSKA